MEIESDLKIWTSELSDQAYFQRQFSEPYESTVEIFNLLDELVDINSDSKILDACCGSGANAIYAVERYRLKNIRGFDFNKETIEAGKDFILKTNKCGIELYTEDLFKLSNKIMLEMYDGIVLHQTLSWMNRPYEALDVLGGLDTKWIAISSLFYDGLLEAWTQVKRYDENGRFIGTSPYNTYSTKLITQRFRSYGFKKIKFVKFNIKRELNNSDVNRMGTTTQKMKNGINLQISGPLLMPWMFCVAIK